MQKTGFEAEGVGKPQQQTAPESVSPTRISQGRNSPSSNMWQHVLSTREPHLSSGVQNFYWGSAMLDSEIDLCYLPLQSLGDQSDPAWPRASHPRKNTPTRQDITRAQRLSPGSQGRAKPLNVGLPSECTRFRREGLLS